MRTVLVWAPTSGHIGMSVSIFSYRGEVTVGLMVDAALVPDPDQIVVRFERELETLAHLERPVQTASHRPPAASGWPHVSGETKVNLSHCGPRQP